MEYIASTVEHIVLKGATWSLLDLLPGSHLATSTPFDVYTDRAEAIAAMLAHDPSFEPEEWDWTPPTREEIAKVRWEHETGGTMWSGHKVRTDRESQSLVLGAMVLGQPVRWKFADSWADMTPQDMQSLVATVAQHVEACFRREEELQQDPTQDITSGWPAGWTT
jgi:hypothetical protein